MIGNYPYTEENIIIRRIAHEQFPAEIEYRLYRRLYKFSWKKFKYIRTDDSEFLMEPLPHNVIGDKVHIKYETYSAALHQKHKILKYYGNESIYNYRRK